MSALSNKMKRGLLLHSSFSVVMHITVVQNDHPINGHYAIWLLIRTSQLKSKPPPSSGMTADSAAQFKVYIQTQLRYVAIYLDDFILFIRSCLFLRQPVRSLVLPPAPRCIPILGIAVTLLATEQSQFTTAGGGAVPHRIATSHRLLILPAEPSVRVILRKTAHHDHHDGVEDEGGHRIFPPFP